MTNNSNKIALVDLHKLTFRWIIYLSMAMVPTSAYFENS
jgi:hypothetical protein